MTTAQAENLVELVLAAFPATQTRDETFGLYVRFLLDLDYRAAKEGIDELISVSTEMPTIAAIRRYVIEDELQIPTPAEAWISVSDTSRKHELHKLATQARELLGGSWAIRTSDQPSIMRAQYLKLYDELRERALVDANRRSRKGRSIRSAGA